MKIEESILREALSLLEGDRADDYGSIVNNFMEIRNIYNTLAKEGIQLQASDIALVMIAVKLGREKFKHKRDNLVDASAYIEIYSMLKEYELKLEEKYGNS